MAVVDLEKEVKKAGDYPQSFNKREAKLLESVKSFMGARVVAIGTHQTVADSSSPHENTITNANVKNTDIVFAMVRTEGASPVSIKRAIAQNGSILIQFSGDPSNDHHIYYVVLRAV